MRTPQTGAVLALQTFTLLGLLTAIASEAGAPRTTIWSLPWVVVYTTTTLGALAIHSSAARPWRWLGLVGAALTAVGAALRTLWRPPGEIGLGALQPSDLPIVLAIGLVSLGVLLSSARPRETAQRSHWRVMVAAGLLLVWGLTLLSEYVARPNLWHGSEFYVVTGAVVPLALAFAAGATSGAWAATGAAGGYMAVALGAMWAIQALPARGTSQLLPPPFPLVLVLPGLAVDLLNRVPRLTSSRVRQWLVLGAMGPVIVVTMIAVHWPLADFLLTPAARGWAFGADQWPYHADLGPWRYQYWSLDPGTRVLAARLALAALLGSCSASFGWWLARRETLRRLR